MSRSLFELESEIEELQKRIKYLSMRVNELSSFTEQNQSDIQSLLNATQEQENN